jgi:integrase
VMDNPLEKVKIQAVHYDPQVISAEEFELFLSTITEENGTGTKGSEGTHKVNYYRPWLKKVFVLSLLIGERLDGVVLLRWSHVEGNFFKIPNFKVNRIQKVDKYYSYTPITADLAELLLQFEMTAEDAYIVAPEYGSRYSLKKFISKAFTHYWRVTGLKREVSFKTLRKTYETRLTEAIGSKAMFVKHSSDKTAIRHYIGRKELLEATKDIRLYDISGWF